MRFPKWKDKAMTLSYDDGAKEDILLIEIMQKYGLRGTFNICSKRLETEPENRTPIEVYLKANMEVGMHGANHLWVNGCIGGDIVQEFYQDKIKLEDVTGQVIRGGAYAYGCYNDEALAILKVLGISYFRGVSESYGFEIPTDWLKWSMTCRHKNEKLFSILDSFLSKLPDKPYNHSPRLFYLMGHSWEFTADNNWDLIEKFGKKVAERDDIWHATNIEVYDYVKAYEGLIFSTKGDKILNNSSIDVYLCVDGKNILAKANTMTIIDKENCL